jgi:hypothetical protein
MAQKIIVFVLIFLGILTIISVAFLLANLWPRNQPSDIGVRGRWSGFGGGRAGWEISRGLASLFLTIFFGTLTAGVAGYQVHVEEKSRQDADASERLKSIQEILISHRAANSSCPDIAALALAISGPEAKRDERKTENSLAGQLTISVSDAKRDEKKTEKSSTGHPRAPAPPINSNWNSGLRPCPPTSAPVSAPK